MSAAGKRRAGKVVAIVLGAVAAVAILVLSPTAMATATLSVPVVLPGR